ncbi:MAG: SAM-dependent methyltransferase, partial [bacterium]
MTTDLIRRFTLKARQLLTQEVGDLLEGVYGLRSDGAFEPTRNLPALLELPEAGKTRKQLECFLEDEESAGLSRRDAYAKLLKETAFTHLNRLVAFKMMEARGLRRGVLDKHQDSNEFLFYLADATHAGDYGLYQQGSFPQDALGEGPRDRAYRHFLLWLCGQTAQEIKVLFDPGNLPSR